MAIDSNNPLISVIMPMHNNQEHVHLAIESILTQSLSDFEFLIIDDGSQDESCRIIHNVSDPRIQLIENERNIGIARTLNRAISLARGRYLARMDADDVSFPSRLGRQVSFMEKRPEVGVSGSWVYRFGGKRNFVLRYPVGSSCVRSFLLFGNPLAHPSTMIRRQFLEAEGLSYAPDCPAAQDYELWSRCSHLCELDNIPEPLVKWRVNPMGVTSSQFDLSNDVTLRVQRGWLNKLGLRLDESDLLFHREVGNGSGVRSFEELDRVASWLSQLLHANCQRRIFPRAGLKAASSFVWFRVCLNSSGLGPGVLYRYLRSPFRSGYLPGRQEISYLLVNSLLRLNRAPTGRLDR